VRGVDASLRIGAIIKSLLQHLLHFLCPALTSKQPACQSKNNLQCIVYEQINIGYPMMLAMDFRCSDTYKSNKM
jgi:hypothetical protein